MANTISLAGLDVHANQTHAATLDRASGELRRKTLRCEPVGVVTTWRPLAPSCCRL